MPAALKEAGEKNRPILFDIYKVPCPPCSYLDNVVYRDPAVIKFINDNYIALKINGEVESVRIRENELIQRFPTLLYMTAGGQILETQIGALEAPALVEQAKKALTALAALQPTQPAQPKSKPTPFLARVRTGPTAARPNVWSVSQYFPPSGPGFSYQALNGREERVARARDLLAQAEDNYRKQQWLACLDQSRSLITFYPDLPESTQARQLEQSIGAERLERLGKDLLENLGQIYWELAQDRIRQNQVTQATHYMEKIVQTCPGTRYAPAAQDFLRTANRVAGEQHATHFRP